jgi:hypothetical protein
MHTAEAGGLANDRQRLKKCFCPGTSAKIEAHHTPEAAHLSPGDRVSWMFG